VSDVAAKVNATRRKRNGDALKFFVTATAGTD
jgi:hypothetical protein